MRRAGFFLQIFAVLSALAALTGCQAESIQINAGPMPLTGENASRLGAAVLALVEQPGSNSFTIVPISAKTGQPVADAQPITLGGEISYRFSRDRTQMAFLSNRSEGCEKYCLRVMDLRAWQEIGLPVRVKDDYSTWFLLPEFTANSPALPVIINYQTDTISEVALVDFAQAAETTRVPLPATVLQAATTPAGDLAIFGLYTLPDGSGAEGYLALINSADLHSLWEQKLPEVVYFEEGGQDHSDLTKGRYYEPAAVFSPDASKLYIMLANQPRLLTVDFAQRSVQSSNVQPKTGWLDRLFAIPVAHGKSMNGIRKSGAISPDGRTLYVVGQEERVTKNAQGEYLTERIPLGMQVIDTRDGTLIRAEATQANLLSLSPDGNTILLTGWQEDTSGGRQWTDLLDTTTWEVSQRLDGFARPTRLLDGSQAWLVLSPDNAGSGLIDLYRPGDRNPHVQIQHERSIDWIAIP